MVSDPTTSTGWRGRLERGLGALAARNYRRPGAALAVAVALSLLGVFFARGLSLDANLVSLLPKSFQSVEDLHELEKRFGGMGWVVVVGEGAEPEALRRFADDMAPKLEALPGIRFVEVRRPGGFFEEHALYYLSLEDLEEVERRLQSRITYEKERANPLFVDLMDEGPPSVDFSDLEAKYGASGARRLSGSGEAYYLDEGARRVVLLAKPEGSSADLDFSRRVITEVENLLAAQNLSAYGPGFKTAITGTFQKKLDQQHQIGRDIAVSSAVAGALLLIFLFIHFRSALAVGMVLAPVGMGLAWTYGLVGLAYGRVNLLTGFLGAILGGLGIEHGIHLLGRYLHLRGENWKPEHALRESFTHTGSAALISALVAALTFLLLGTSRFRAFREFGVIAGVGMLLLVAAYVLVLPAVLGLASRLGWKPGPAATAHLNAPLGRLLVRWRRPLTVVSALLVGGLVLDVARVRFDYNFSSLEDQQLPSFVLDRQVNRLIGYSQTPVVVLTNSPEEERAVVEELRARKAQLGERSTVDFVASLATLVPEDQARKQQVLQRLQGLLKDVPEEQLEPQQREQLAELREQVQAPPFTREQLPTSVRRQFQGTQGQSGFVLVYPSISLGSGEAIRAMAREVRGVQLPGGGRISAAGEPMVLADILEMVTHEAPRILIGTVLVVLLAMWVTLGNLRLALLCLTPTVVSLLALVGLMPLLGMEFNYLNILVIPVLIGTTVDAGVHLLTRLVAPDSDFVSVYSETGRAICGGLLTSAVGFGALFLADHPGLNSVGALANLGFGVNLLVMVVAFPALLLLLSERRRRKQLLRRAHARDEAPPPPPSSSDVPSAS
ncbi:efflux RND transporter permease subunit [Hyalangium rubrum]|uniref:MMPL family transporter n=1 Tax=Hyalangium rubrum TaxID=3103134 RepID=A0ABU5GZG8_9BACT|nr:MMPL family transporter [Hyalangium sp. s54d21]MDY7226094.1 MMPL family transporter [Hyalangium sp. s54d21]